MKTEYFMTILPTKKNPPRFLIYICTFAYVVIAGLVIAQIVNLVGGRRNFTTGLIAVGIYLLLKIIDKSFSWYAYQGFYVKNDKLCLDADDIVDVFGHSVSTFKFNNISGIKRRGSKLRIYGDITSKLPMSKPKSVKFVDIEDVTDEHIKALEKYWS